MYAGLEPTLMALKQMRTAMLVPWVSIELWYVECDSDAVRVVRDNYKAGFMCPREWEVLVSHEQERVLQNNDQVVVLHIVDAHTFQAPEGLLFHLMVVSPDCEQYSAAGNGEGKYRVMQTLQDQLKPGAGQRIVREATLQLQSALRIFNMVTHVNPQVRVLLEEVVMGSSELGDPWRELLQVFDMPFNLNFQSADLGGHSRARCFGSTHHVQPLHEIQNAVGSDWQDYLCDALAPAAKAHAFTTVNIPRRELGQTAVLDGQAELVNGEKDFDARSPYYNFVYCLTHNRWRSMFRIECEKLMGWPAGYTSVLDETSAKVRIAKGIDVGIMQWVLLNWFANPAILNTSPVRETAKCATARPPVQWPVDSNTMELTAPTMVPIEKQRQQNIKRNNAMLCELGLHDINPVKKTGA